LNRIKALKALTPTPATPAIPATPANTSKLMNAKPSGELAKKDEVKLSAEEIAAKIARARVMLVHKEFLNWTPSKQEPLMREIYPTAAVTRWITDRGLDELQKSGDAAGGRVTKLLVTALLSPQENLESDPTDLSTLPKGFLIRQAINGLLRFCEGPCPSDGNVTNVLKADSYSLPQLGRYVAIPLRNRIFETQTLTIGVNPEGSITKLGLKSNATAEAALNSVNTDLDALNKAKTARDKAQADARTAAKTSAKVHADQVTAENAAVSSCLAAQKAVRDAGGTVVGVCQ
jgi:hypothetical protein